MSFVLFENGLSYISLGLEVMKRKGIDIGLRLGGKKSTSEMDYNKCFFSLTDRKRVFSNPEKVWCPTSATVQSGNQNMIVVGLCCVLLLCTKKMVGLFFSFLMLMCRSTHMFTKN